MSADFVCTRVSHTSLLIVPLTSPDFGSLRFDLPERAFRHHLILATSEIIDRPFAFDALRYPSGWMVAIPIWSSFRPSDLILRPDGDSLPIRKLSMARAGRKPGHQPSHMCEELSPTLRARGKAVGTGCSSTRIIHFTSMARLEMERRHVRFLALVTNGQGFVDEHPHQPAAKRAFVFEPRRIPRCP